MRDGRVSEEIKNPHSKIAKERDFRMGHLIHF